jgi:LysR family glycine cleavage system transcriptional activator
MAAATCSLRSAGAGVQLPEAGKVTKLDTMIAVVRAAERGIGAALVPVPLSDAWIESGSLVRLFDHVLVADVSYYLVYRKTALADDGVAALRDWVLQTFADGR